MKNLNVKLYYEKFKRQNVLWKIWTWKCIMKNLNVKMYYEKFERQNVLWKT